MVDLVASAEFERWLRELRDLQAKARILVRLNRVAEGNCGDVKSLGGGLSELRITHGPGYRIYITQRGSTVVLLLCGGDKSTQKRDIARARQIATEYKE